MNYGSHSDHFPVLPFFVAAAAIGQTQAEIDLFIVRLDDAFGKFRAQRPDLLKELAPLENEEAKNEDAA